MIGAALIRSHTRRASKSPLGYRTTVTIIDDPTTAVAADALQAARFRDALVAERDQLVVSISKRRAIIDRRATTGRLRGEVRDAEIEVSRLNRMIDGLDRRFTTL
jgi:hypothetical protein